MNLIIKPKIIIMENIQVVLIVGSLLAVSVFAFRMFLKFYCPVDAEEFAQIGKDWVGPGLHPRKGKFVRIHDISGITLLGGTEHNDTNIEYRVKKLGVFEEYLGTKENINPEIRIVNLIQEKFMEEIDFCNITNTEKRIIEEWTLITLGVETEIITRSRTRIKITKPRIFDYFKMPATATA